jgi:hypothetical protein
MSKIDTVRIQSEKKWVDLGTKNIEELSISNFGDVDSIMDLVIGPNSLVNGTSDTGCIYFLKATKIPIGATLVLDNDWLLKAFSGGMTIYTNTSSLGVLTRTKMNKPRFLIRTDDSYGGQKLDCIILRK